MFTSSLFLQQLAERERSLDWSPNHFVADHFYHAPPNPPKENPKPTKPQPPQKHNHSGCGCHCCKEKLLKELEEKKKQAQLKELEEKKKLAQLKELEAKKKEEAQKLEIAKSHGFCCYSCYQKAFSSSSWEHYHHHHHHCC
ncbi:hypothetical protein H4219_005683 [Mycoemilia scoparia]|uniref:Uncharacterized protein n=1 Tax=Mycoemilia scoparia TaxID=417184 RepID=A0A9W7ZS92_9FUNG|nr:hypothetical protein H4219_005683 [Mycoemilia scoparia]